MKILVAFAAALLCAMLATAQDTFTATGSAIPASLLAQNYGSMPKGIVGYDLTICNATDQKQSVTSSQVYQALAASNVPIMPVGSQMILASILGSERNNILTLVTAGLNTAVGAFSLMGTSKRLNPPAGVKTGVGLASLSLQLTSNLRSVRPAEKLQKLETDALPQALILDSNSCVEKTLFAVATTPNVKPATIAFHIN